MKLVNRFTIWYLAITALVLLAGSVIVFTSVQHENDDEEGRRLLGLVQDEIAILKGTLKRKNATSQVNVKEIDYNKSEVPFSIVDTLGWHSEFQGTERELIARQSLKLNNKHYLITAYAFAPEPEETVAGTIRSLAAIFILLLVLVGITSIIVSRKILRPFHLSLNAIKTFNLKQRENLQLPDTRTEEFRMLNSFLSRMTAKALDDYRTLKEFSENASHELQTPLAIIRGKLELLLQSEISDDQAKLISTASEAVDKLARTNQALILLTKLDNQEYPSQPINLSEATEKSIALLQELIEMKSLSLEKNIQQDVMVAMHPSLADILLMNLLSNAIRHNFENGSIKIRLNKRQLTIENTGEPIRIPTDQLFVRFKKNAQSSDSAGLGLSIVKRICEINGFSINYYSSHELHRLEVGLD
ncbi:MAG TPA: HAMP domain-containing sensor histidine kinase [Chryseosolibacter sp.]